MTLEMNTVAAVIDDARALMDALLANDWSEVHVTGHDFEIFIAKEGGGANPMLGQDLGDGPNETLPAGPVKTLSAPHVATVEWVAEVGVRLEVGQSVVRLSVLDEVSELPAAAGGSVVRVHAVPGQMVEFGAPLVDVAEAG